MDTSVPQEYISEIGKKTSQLARIEKVTNIRARQSGQKIFLDIAIQLDPNLSVFESKRITQALRAHLRKEDRYIGDIFVKVIPAP
jgi:divalent metal cation (Fe/Co/Zn/Cd) transporter